MNNILSKFFLFFCFAMFLFANSENTNEKEIINKAENLDSGNEVLGYWVGYNFINIMEKFMGEF